MKSVTEVILLVICILILTVNQIDDSLNSNNIKNESIKAIENIDSLLNGSLENTRSQSQEIYDIKYFEDNFNNELNIAYKRNIKLDSIKNEITLILKNNKTFYTFINCTGSVYLSSVLNTSDGGYIIVGWDDRPGRSKQFILLTKIDSQGNIQWNKSIFGGSLSFGWSIIETPDKGYLIAGTIGSRKGYEYNDGWLIKTDKNGNMEWNKTYGGKNEDNLYSVQMTSDGGYILGGLTDSFNITDDLWLLKTDKFGNEQWNNTYGDKYKDDSGGYALETSDGGYFIIGSMLIRTDNLGNELWRNDLGGRPINKTSDGGYVVTGGCTIGEEDSDVQLIKLYKGGGVDWIKKYGGNRRDYGNDVYQTNDGGFIIVGVKVFENPYQRVGWLIKTNSYGEMVWNKTFYGTSEGNLISVLQTQDGGYVFCGLISRGTGKSPSCIIKTDKNGNLNFNGIIESINLLEGKNSSSIDIFQYQTEIPNKTENELPHRKRCGISRFA